MKLRIVLAILSIAAIACDGSTAPRSSGSVAVKFGAGSSSAVSATVLATDPRLAADQVTLVGTNATLVIEDVRFIVEEMKLRSSSVTSTCADDDDDRVLADRSGSSGDDDVAHVEDEHDDECEFEGGPFIVDLSLDGTATIATENVPAGVYDSFRFKVDDLEEDDGDEIDDRARTPALLAEIRAVYPNFPSRASLVVKGTQDGQPFIVYFRSKLEISQPISPPLTIPGDEALTVRIDPAGLFKIGTQVLDLLALNGQLVESGLPFESGVSGVRRGEN
jgi:hypothetical protein